MGRPKGCDSSLEGTHGCFLLLPLDWEQSSTSRRSLMLFSGTEFLLESQAGWERSAGHARTSFNTKYQKMF